ncbi:nucleoside phosphorylase [Clostridium beijerinckii]|nr:nucleoside phosphorylase [Clostridium beijerinckii]
MREIAELNSFTGRIASGDQFIANIEKIHWLDQEFGAISCEMEGASIAQVCY